MEHCDKLLLRFYLHAVYSAGADSVIGLAVVNSDNLRTSSDIFGVVDFCARGRCVPLGMWLMSTVYHMRLLYKKNYWKKYKEMKYKCNSMNYMGALELL